MGLLVSSGGAEWAAYVLLIEDSVEAAKKIWQGGPLVISTPTLRNLLLEKEICAIIKRKTAPRADHRTFNYKRVCGCAAEVHAGTSRTAPERRSRGRSRR